MKVPEPRVVVIDGAVGSRLFWGSVRTDSTVAVLCWRRQGCLPTAPTTTGCTPPTLLRLELV
jgi:hypothetical protein